MSMRHLSFLRYVDEVARAGSIRKAAEQLHVTASAVNRRVMDLEEELGAPLFERRPRGVRLTAAGELFVRYIREQSADVERMKSQIEDLKGLRRGTVRIACSQALRSTSCRARSRRTGRSFPLVQFDVKVFDHERAMATLAAYEVDLVLVFRPPFLANFQPLMTPAAAARRADAGGSSARGAQEVRLSDCVGYPVALAGAQPRRTAAARRGAGALEPALRHRGANPIRSSSCAAWCCATR